MEAYANALLYAIPFFIGLVLFEVLYGHFKKKQTHRMVDTISSLSSGLTNIVKDSLGLAVVIFSYPYLLEHLAIYEIQQTWLVYTLAFIAMDFGSYWNHRLSHRVNFFWNQHVIHHSSEEFNLACALRQSISNLLGYFPILLLPAALIGVPNSVIATIAPIHLFAQFWYHTKHIGKLGVLEYIIVTPSQHRVHHAINTEYIDKNLGAIFCVWDRMFGTFQEELEDVPPVYGILKPAKTWNPVLINFQHIWRLIKDAWHTRNIADKFRIWFMPTGWRPADVIDTYPYQLITNPYVMEKYDTYVPVNFRFWYLFQLLATTLLMLAMFYNFGDYSRTELLLFGSFIFLGIMSYTTSMDNLWYGWIYESIRFLPAIYVIVLDTSWFQIGQYSTTVQLGLGLYVILSFVVSIYISRYYAQQSGKLKLSKSV